jgi:SET domain-containing protein
MKQDAIKRFLGLLKNGKYKDLSRYKDNYSMEFYNIFLEKHKDEPNGTELVIIDPILKGNYASRLSHSCTPNCITMPVVSNKKYNIGKSIFSEHFHYFLQNYILC